jgi:lipoprotein-releasing system ATP-binding protein
MLLSIKKLRKTYFNASGKKNRVVLNGLDLDIFQGEKIAITGPSGSGKSTLLNLAGALDFPDEGEIIYQGIHLSSQTKEALAKFRNHEIGYVFQFHHLLPQCTLLENILLPSIPFRDLKTDYRQRAEEMMKVTGIWELRDQKPGEVSGGECQRTALVRALINHPSLLLADEPTGALDEENTEAIIRLLLNFNQMQGITLVVVTHSPALASKMDKQYRLLNGKLGVMQ